MTMTIRLALAAAIALPALSIANATTPDGFSSAHEDNLVEKRRKPRQKGGSGCDDPRDVVEHPECR